MKNRYCYFHRSFIAVVLNVLFGVLNVEAQTGCPSKKDGLQPVIAIPVSQVVSASNLHYPIQRLSEKISDILQNNHCFQVIDPNKVIALMGGESPDPQNVDRYVKLLKNDFFFLSKVMSWDEDWTPRTIFMNPRPIGYKYKLRMEFKVEILCKQGVYGYSHIETIQYEKNVGTNKETPNDRDVKIDEMLQVQCKLLQENLANVITQCSGDIPPPPPPPERVQIKLTSISYNQYTAIDSCLKHHSDAITILDDILFRNNGGYINVKLKGRIQSLVDIVRGCVDLKVVGIQSNLIELSGQ